MADIATGADSATGAGTGKPVVRATILAARRSAWAGVAEPVEEATARAEALRELLATIPPAAVNEPRILSYLSFIDEPDTAPLHSVLRQCGYALALVRLRPDLGLDVVAFDSDADLSAGPRGTRAPDGPALDPAVVSLAVVPALAVDPVTGVRLGRGGGSYDRLLPALSAPVAALLRAADELIDLSGVAESHDEAVGMVALPEGIRRVGARPTRQVASRR